MGGDWRGQGEEKEENKDTSIFWEVWIKLDNNYNDLFVPCQLSLMGNKSLGHVQTLLRMVPSYWEPKNDELA